MRVRNDVVEASLALLFLIGHGEVFAALGADIGGWCLDHAVDGVHLLHVRIVPDLGLQELSRAAGPERLQQEGELVIQVRVPSRGVEHAAMFECLRGSWPRLHPPSVFVDEVLEVLDGEPDELQRGGAAHHPVLFIKALDLVLDAVLSTASEARLVGDPDALRADVLAMERHVVLEEDCRAYGRGEVGVVIGARERARAVG